MFAASDASLYSSCSRVTLSMICKRFDLSFKTSNQPSIANINMKQQISVISLLLKLILVLAQFKISE